MIKIKYYCIDCDSEICMRTAKYGNKRCKSCANKGKRNPNYNNHLFKEKSSNWKGGLPKCLDCGKKLVNYNTKRCIKCFPNSRKNKPRTGKPRFGKSAPSYKDGRCLKSKYCLQCNKKINWKSTLCVACAGILRRGENNPNYMHGMGNFPYPLTFSRFLKSIIKKRDNLKCANCNISELTHLKKFKQKLHIHHIDYNKNNCCEENLITLCQKCNINANFNRDYWYAYFKYLIKYLYHRESKD